MAVAYSKSPAAGLKMLDGARGCRRMLTGARLLTMLGFVLTSFGRRAQSSSTRTCAAVAPDKPATGGPAWVISTEYPSLGSDELRGDLKRARDVIDEIRQLEGKIGGYVPQADKLSADECKQRGVLDALGAIAALRWEAETLLRNVGVYASCEKSVDGLNSSARKLSLEVQEVGATLREGTMSKNLFLMRCKDEVVREFLGTNAFAKAEEVLVKRDRKLKDSRLSLPEEKLLTSMSVHGYSSWGTLYSTISGTIRCEINPGEPAVGLATAAGLLDSGSEGVRRAAWEAIQRGWAAHEESCAAALNAMVGWRLELYNRRGIHFLDVPLHQNHMTRSTLDAMLDAVEARSEMARQVLSAKARLLGKDKLDAWDLFAPLPAEYASESGIEERYTFEEAVALIRDAVADVDPQIGQFVEFMTAQGWIEARTGNSKVPGAYQTSFAKSRTPRVYLSNFNGGAKHVLTLAHELGHAFHDWTMRELALAETSLGMNVAETASIFFETVVADALLKRTKDRGERLRILWASTENATAFLLNIPARYRFEEELHVRRAKQSLTPEELSEIMERAWRHQYRDTLDTVESHFWQSKLHFYITGVCFYNFPYTAGFLLALGIYSQRDRHGDRFFDLYTSLLRDSGKMDTEELISVHLGEDVTQAGFWNASLDAVQQLCDSFVDEAEGAQALRIPGPAYEV